MYNSLKKQQRMRIAGHRRTVCCKPLHSGRSDASIASSEEADLIAISTAMRKGRPIYLIRSGDGTTLDVVLDRAMAIRTRDHFRERIHNGRPNIQAYERISTVLVPI